MYATRRFLVVLSFLSPVRFLSVKGQDVQSPAKRFFTGCVNSLNAAAADHAFLRDSVRKLRSVTRRAPFFDCQMRCSGRFVTDEQRQTNSFEFTKSRSQKNGGKIACCTNSDIFIEAVEIC